MRYRKKILMITKFCPPFCGGLENYVYGLAQSISDRWEVTILGFNTGPQTVYERLNNINIIKIATYGTLRSMPICIGMQHAISKAIHYYGPFDVVNVHLPNPITMLCCLRIPNLGKLVVTWHGDITRQKLLYKAVRPFERRILMLSERIIVSSQAYLKTSEPLREFRHKASICPCFVDINVTDRVPLRKPSTAPSKSHGAFWVCSVSRLVKWKGVQFLIQAMEYLPENIHALIVGDGPYLKALRQLVRKKQLGDRVYFLGEQKMDNGTLQWCLKNSNLFCLLSISRNESFGIVQLEAMACGLPVIVSDIYNGQPVLVEPGITGLVVPKEDPKTIAEAIRVMWRNEKWTAVAGQKAREVVQAKYTRERCAKIFLKIISD